MSKEELIEWIYNLPLQTLTDELKDDIVEKIDDFLIAREAQGAKEGGCKKFPAALVTIEIYVKQITRVELNLNPGTTVGNDTEPMEKLSVRMHRCFETNAWGTMQL